MNYVVVVYDIIVWWRNHVILLCYMLAFILNELFSLNTTFYEKSVLCMCVCLCVYDLACKSIFKVNNIEQKSCMLFMVCDKENLNSGFVFISFPYGCKYTHKFQ